MILTCSKCAKRYLVDKTALGTEGRQVRCAACGHTWVQPSLPVTEDHFLHAVDDFDADLHDDPPDPSSSGSLSWGWASFIVAILSLAVIVISGRDYIIHQWPVTQPLYHMLGLKTSKAGAGLAIKNVVSLQRQVNGHNYVVVKGSITNASKEMRAIPNLRISLRGDCSPATGWSQFSVKWLQPSAGTGRRQCVLKEWTHVFSETRLLPGEQISFETSPQETVNGAKSIEIRF